MPTDLGEKPPVPYYEDDGVTLYLGDCREVLSSIDLSGEVDVTVTDPPYGETALKWDIPPRDWLYDLPGNSLWCFGSLRMFLELGISRQLEGWKFAQDIVWEKHNGSNSAADRFRRVHEIAAQFYRGEWAEVYRSPVMTNDATKRTVRRKRRPPHWGEIGGHQYVSEDGGPRLQRSVMHVRSCHGYAEHETQKPLGILTPLIEYSSAGGGARV